MFFHILGCVCNHVLEIKPLYFVNNTGWKISSTVMILDFSSMVIYQYTFQFFLVCYFIQVQLPLFNNIWVFNFIDTMFRKFPEEIMILEQLPNQFL